MSLRGAAGGKSKGRRGNLVGSKAVMHWLRDCHAIARNDMVLNANKAQAQRSERAGRAYGGNAGLAFARDASAASHPAKALRTGRERRKHSL